ncbi:MAG: glycosyltransferase family 4 protein, partial [Candidatus Bathyarchaeota archaeon]|nr:glycosyltransferase family 4 protein [Candidatus Bathyarchaeota archaeon]
MALKREFRKEGHKVKLILPREKLPQAREKDTILLGSSLYIPGNASRTSLSLNITPLSVWRKINKEKFDILHFQNFGAFLPVQILEAASQLSKPPLKILTLHAFWDASFILKELPSIPTIINIFQDYILPRFDGIIGVSKPVLAQIKYKGPQEVIPNGVDFNLFNPKGPKIKRFSNVQKETPGTRSKLKILFVGRIEKRKGLSYLVRAFKTLKQRYKKIKLIIVGEGEREDKIKNFINKNKIQDVFFEGTVGDTELIKYYRSADICCFPSIYGEAFGIVLLE